MSPTLKGKRGVVSKIGRIHVGPLTSEQKGQWRPIDPAPTDPLKRERWIRVR